MSTTHRVVAALILCTLACGCVTGRRKLTLKVPKGIPGTTAFAGSTPKGRVSIQSVTDSRQFQNKPKEPSTPSVNGDVNKVSKEQRATFVGRQRNGFGMAMGDIVLKDPETVPAHAKQLVSEGFARHGYTTTTGGTPVDVDVQEFWAWFTPGMWTIDFEARVKCAVNIRGAKPAALVVNGYGKNMGQIASDQNWQQAYDAAFKDFLGDLSVKLHNAGY
jgi:hypothetical protein